MSATQLYSKQEIKTSESEALDVEEIARIKNTLGDEAAKFTDAELLEASRLENPDADVNKAFEPPSPDVPDPDGLQWDQDGQREVLSLFCHEESFAAEVADLLRPSDFREVTHLEIYKIVQAYWKQYRSLPSHAQIVIEYRPVIAEKTAEVKAYWMGELGVVYGFSRPRGESMDYYLRKIREFVKANRMRQLLLSTFQEIKKTGSVDMVKFEADKTQLLAFDSQKTSKTDFFLDEMDQIPKPEWLVDQHLSVNGFATVFGAYGTMKSFYAVDLCLSIASGSPFLGRFDVIQGKALYMAAEGGSGIRKRCDAWKIEHPGTDLPPRNFLLERMPYDFHGNAAAADLVARFALERFGEYPKIIVIDTLARYFGSGDENQTKDMNMYVANIARLAELTGANVLSIHHTGKDETKKTRGAVAFPGACDNAIELKKSAEGIITARCEKMKESEMWASYEMKPVKVAVDYDKDGSLALEYIGKAGELSDAEKMTAKELEEAELLQFAPVLNGAEVTKDTGWMQDRFETEMNWAAAKVYRVLHRLVEKNKIARTKLKSTSVTAPYFYYQEGLLA